MKTPEQATDVLDVRQRLAAGLSVCVAKINATQEDVDPVTEAFERVLDIASCCPGGQQALIEGLRMSTSSSEVLAFCKAFVHTMGVAALMGDAVEAVHDLPVAA